MGVGDRFVPTDQELIRYLGRKENGENIKCDRYCLWEEQLYGAESEPWNLFVDDDPRWVDDVVSSKKKMLYVFCRPAKVGGSGKNVSRVAGCGTWLGKAREQEVKDSDIGGTVVIGKKRSFSFVTAKEKAGGRWIMHEYSVQGYRYVVCRIIKYLPRETTLLPNDGERSICPRMKRKCEEEEGESSCSTNGKLVMKKECSSYSNDLIIDLEGQEDDSTTGHDQFIINKAGGASGYYCNNDDDFRPLLIMDNVDSTYKQQTILEKEEEEEEEEVVDDLIDISFLYQTTN